MVTVGDFITGTAIDISGSHLQGEFVATRREIEAVFGAPTYEDEGDKVTTEWVIRFDGGVLATVYDWKRYDEGAPAMDEAYSWHIGGYDGDAVARVLVALGRGE